MNVLVTGSNGQLGNELRELSSRCEFKLFFTDIENLDITDKDKIADYVRGNNINAVINCAAYTAVDKAEEEQVLSDKINRIAVRNLGLIAKEKAIKLVHISTDYVFNGKNYRPYHEDDKTSPINIYGKTKLDGEKALQEIEIEDSIIIRTSWLYSAFGNNFVKTMLKLGKGKKRLDVIFDQIGTPTYAGDLAESILEVLPKVKNNKVEIYHYSNEGVCSWYDFAYAVMKIAEIDCYINPVKTEDFPAKALRPYYSVLDKTKIKNDFDLSIPNWQLSLKNFILKFKNIII